MHLKLVLGVDISKDTFNFCLMNSEYEICTEGEIINAPDAIYSFIKKLLKSNKIDNLSDVLLCMEHTGVYVQHLSNCWLSKGGQHCIVPATKVSEHLAGQFPWEEKTDELDARRLAEYAFRYADKLQLSEAKNPVLLKLQGFQRQRERLLSAINMLEVPVKESAQFDSFDLSNTLKVNQTASMIALKSDLNNLEQHINELIDLDDTLSKLYKLIISVEGVGPVTAREILIATDAFTKFTPNEAKAFARYTGVVPLMKRSGKSIRKKDRIPKRKHKKLKSLLTMGAQSLTRSKQELGFYYRRKINEGKHHLSVINAMRNKIILRVFAVVRNQVIYQKNLNESLE